MKLKTDLTWKEKAIQRQIENKNMRKRIKEAKQSRDKWKEKAIERKDDNNKLKKELKRIKKNLTKIIDK